MNIEYIKISDAYESPTNPRVIREDQAFKDLVASIKEKGILVPVIARVGSGRRGFEIVAGNRRLKAAKAAGLKEIPAEVREMDDAEAREVQIIENLQRADVHPLDEGEAYRQLREKENHEIKSISIKVGKNEDYIRSRMILTNLVDKVKEAYRAGKIQDGHAMLIARLGLTDQPAALKFCLDKYEPPTVKRLKEEIEEKFYKPLDHQPWIGKPDIEKVVGKCQECPPNKNDLFGSVKEGACTDLKCWKRKMAAYLESRVKTEKLLRLSDEYSAYGKDKKSGVYYEREYKGLSSKTKEHCEFAKQGIMIDGPNIGTLRWVCIDGNCKTHHDSFGGYKQTPQEKAARKRQLAQAAAKEKKEFEEIAKAGKKISWPFSEKHLEVLITITLGNGNSDPQRKFVKSKGYEILRTTHTGYNTGSYPDYKKTLEAEFAKLDTKAKAQLLFEILLNETGNWDGRRNKIIKML